ncbi:MAG: hypothetical protein JWQ09_2866, partial [Segetibacter sp.]|nr:hypothetical protein [Segetibacter sp.]
KKKILFCSYPSKALYSYGAEAKAKNKKEMMRNICNQYPELSSYYRKEVNNKTKYYVKLFEAVAVATIHSLRLIERK